VVAPPAIMKGFGEATIPLNGSTSLSFTISNPNSTVGLTGVTFTDTLPSGLTVTSGSTSQCGGTLTTTAPNTITLTGGTIAQGGNCTFSVNVRAPRRG
jgi:uncharacterized repeat protein (TIGR01451 family)